MSKKNEKLEFFSKVEKINSELLTFTYGSLIIRLMKDFEKPEEINEQLFKMGHNIGVRLIDDFISKSNSNNCQNFKETIETIAKIGFKMYLGVNCDVNVYSENKEFGLIFAENPFNDYVELPDKYFSLWYSNLIPGVIVGAMEAVECNYTKDTLKNGDINEIKVKIIEVIQDKFVDDEE